VEFTPALLKGQIFRSIVLDDWGVTSRRELLPEFRRGLPRAAGNFQKSIRRVWDVRGRARSGKRPKAIGSRTADDEEAAAYAALAPFMSQCVAPGNQIAFSKQVLEGALAEGLFMVTSPLHRRPRSWEPTDAKVTVDRPGNRWSPTGDVLQASERGSALQEAAE
jgi:hypothetical protein